MRIINFKNSPQNCKVLIVMSNDSTVSIFKEKGLPLFTDYDSS